MALRAGHGNGAGMPRVEVLPADELPVGVPELAGPDSPTDRGERGKFARGNKLASKGGKARAGKTRLATKLRLAKVAAKAAFQPYQAAAEAFKTAQVASLARSVGGGYVGPGPASIVASAALQLAASRWYFDRGEHELASKLANDSRQNLLAAHELVAKEAKARPRQSATQAARARILAK